MGWLTDRFLRIDARSLGVFRVLMGLTLIGDLLHRWDWIRAFYSNEGVLPNHHHLFQLLDKEPVWSVYHAFSSVDEARAAFLITLFFYAAFTLGWHTRAMHVVSLVCLVSLTGRNILLENVGNSLAIATMAISALLPLGTRLSLDSLRASFESRDEKTPDALNHRTSTPPTAPASLAALALLLLIGGALLVAGVQQQGDTWKDGSALHYALHVDRWTGALGVWARQNVPAGVLAGWTQALRGAEIAVLPLALIPVARRFVRPVAVGAVLAVGLTFGLLFTFGLYGWTLVAAAALFIPAESWDAAKEGNRPLTLFYDDDCGICLWCARLLKRLDRRHNITFRANSDEEALPEGMTAEHADKSMIVVDADGGVTRGGAALSQLLRSLPLLAPLGLLLRVPGLAQLTDKAYDAIAVRRLDISVAMGLGACGIPTVGPDSEGERESVAPSPAARSWRGARMLLESALAIVMVLAITAQTEAANTLPVKTGLAEKEMLRTIATRPRVMADWGVFAPDPPRENSALVVDAETRDGVKVDALTGYPPDLDLVEPRRVRKGQLWASYTERLQEEDWTRFRGEFRRYLRRGGYAFNARRQGGKSTNLSKMSVYWVTVPTPKPGEAKSKAAPSRSELFTNRGRAGNARSRNPRAPGPRRTRPRRPKIAPKSLRTIKTPAR